METNTLTASGQRNIILDYLKVNGSLSTQYARDTLGIPHPAGRICELRQQGLNIITSWSTEHTPDGEPHRMANYIYSTNKHKEAS